MCTKLFFWKKIQFRQSILHLGDILSLIEKIMSAYEPTLFTLETENILLNEEQEAAQNAYHAATSLNLFENRMFFNIHEFSTNHILTWCSEVLTAYCLGCFDDGDQSHEHAKRMIHCRFKQFFTQACNTSYENVIPFPINWDENVRVNIIQPKSQTDVGKSCFIQDIDAFLASIPIFRAEWSSDTMLDRAVEALCMHNSH